MEMDVLRTPWDITLPFPGPKASDGYIEEEPAELRVLALVPTLSASLDGDWTFSITSLSLLVLAALNDAPQWIALVGTILVTETLGDRSVLTEGIALGVAIFGAYAEFSPELPAVGESGDNFLAEEDLDRLEVFDEALRSRNKSTES